MACQSNLHLISELRSDVSLNLPYDGPHSGHGPHRKYGPQLDYRYIPDKYTPPSQLIPFRYLFLVSLGLQYG
jgi:hypothetical protein